MRSKVRLGNHPLHPAIIAIPIGAFTVALVADLVGALLGDTSWAPTARHAILVGLAGALLAAATGLIDYFGMEMSAAGKRLATVHMILNLIGVAIFAVSYWLRDDQPTTPTSAVVATVAGFALLGASGWLGGKMVYEHKLAVVENADPEAKAIGEREPA